MGAPARGGPPAPGIRRRGAARWLPVALLVAALTLTGCAGPDETGTFAHRVTAWVDGTQFGQNVGTLEGDGARITKVVDTHRGTGAIHTACGVLESDAGTAYATLPSPDTTLTLDVNQAVQLDEEAGTDCYNAGATNLSLLRTSAELRSQADTELRQAVERVESIIGGTVSTTTTTSPNDGGILG